MSVTYRVKKIEVPSQPLYTWSVGHTWDD